MSSGPRDHLSAERMQAFLDGVLPRGEHAGVEEHLAACSRCTEELEGWRLLFGDLSTLARHAPAAGFDARVMASVTLPSEAPLGRRIRERILGLLPAARPAHPASERLQDFLDGALPARQVARLAAHLDACETCASEVDAWRGVYARLGGLPPMAPRPGFADRVMAAVRLPAEAAASTAVRRPGFGTRLDWRRPLAVATRAAARVLPRTRRAWAALAGVAVTPAVTIGLVLYTVFSHPTLTPRALLAFAAWKLTELGSVAWAGLSSVALETGRIIGLDALASSLLEAPAMLAGGTLAYSLVCALALRILYKNLWGQRRHARLSHS